MRRDHYNAASAPPTTPQITFEDDQEYITIKRLGGSATPCSTSNGPSTASNMKNMDIDNRITTAGISRASTIDFETPLTLLSQAVIQLFVTFAVLLKQSPIPDGIVHLTELTANAWVSLNKEYALQKKLLIMMEVIMRIQIFLVSVLLTAILRGLVAFQKTRGYQELMEEKTTSSSSFPSMSNIKPALSPLSPTSANTVHIPLPSIPEDVVTVSVGGVRVSTTWGTLTSENSVFNGVGSNGGGTCVKGIWWRDGLFFVDRDGCHFRHILNHMRGIDTISQIEDQQILKELVLESEFYQLGRLRRQLEMMLGREPCIMSPPLRPPVAPPCPPRSRNPTNTSSSLRFSYEKMKAIVPNPLQSYM
ncbi:hypothetical protein SeMB42_g00510 [Synchytrium endobioticum]|uniref:BTB domain-containing protein n=1 Tax=Synchytrium endobioticum TaxID=286115 RepID=A0A507DLU5_9FUNG|nr:hypothetical protein SeLEV6574_g00063 [Synchytrium endobioticum]TPX53995.1 hypothetical protein SeMB42_g00510 [Synchytrium endobioticum]